MSDVLLIVMPFGGVEGPQIGVSLLKAQLRSRGIPSTVAYLNFPFAEAVGYQAYGIMTSSVQGHYSYDCDSLAGEWMFARSLFSHNNHDDAAYLDRYLTSSYATTPELVDGIRRMAGLVEPFLDQCLRIVDWDRYSIIGFTSTFEQNLASLALAKRVKERFPEKTIVMGGANCTEVMGVQLHQSFPFLDYVFTGEADFSFPELVSRLGNGDGRRDDIPGLVHREGSDSIAIPEIPVRAMDALPYPDFDDYFDAYRASPLRHNFVPVIQIETSRGCWWGEKHHCTFCGLNQNGMAFRGKSPQRAMDELLHLVTRYGVTYFTATDNIISMNYFQTFLPELKRRNLGIKLFYETKANLKKEQVKTLADAGVSVIQPGIESLSAHVLDLMRKGVSPLQNIQILKWCREYGIQPMWNVLCGFPGETAEDYQEVCRIAENLSHLPPPVACIPVNLERFSPYFFAAEEFGIRNVRAHRTYQYIYPFDESVRYNLAYFFDFEYDGQEKIDEWSAPIKALIEHWNIVHSQACLEVVSRTPGSMVIKDTRPNRVHPFYHFTDRQASVIDACDQAQKLPTIIQRVRQRLNGSVPSEAWFVKFVQYLTDCRLFLEHDERYLSLIVRQPEMTSWPAVYNGYAAAGYDTNPYATERSQRPTLSLVPLSVQPTGSKVRS